MSGNRGGYRGNGGGSRGGSRGGHGSPHARTQKGLFENGIWLCDCKPRVPASHFQTKAATKNKGRWFYTCQKSREDPECCRFFLWEDDAKAREARAVLSNSRTEPLPDLTPTRPPRQTSPISPSPPYELQANNDTLAPGRKRDRIPSEEDDDAFGPPINSEEMDHINKTMKSAAPLPETPKKAAKTDAYTTPRRRKLPWLEDSASNGLPTPNTTSRVSKNQFTSGTSSSPGSTKVVSFDSRTDDKELTKGNNLPSPNTTPTPNRFRDVNFGDSDEMQLVTEVFDVLREKNANFNEATKDGLKTVLTKYALRTQGIIKGREVSRLAIKAKDAKITELQHHVTTLEAELEAERALVEHLKWEAENGQQSEG
ncbi:hypothetical protein K432DRAFT_293997 [Lepidopterella palustris CBS 459.81]|uniref:GRF-type domain-containing protein n=1 Tax=Lepidopterella palustris CBS 459.81 TaxID=1314670 RepID=A0A8E2EDL8_9PEZI|nr:hypothetical protein K432DRAFT_293997 [Lepidopterella palustris CBS 459.81]